MKQRYIIAVPAVLILIMFIILPAAACHPVDDDDDEVWVAEYSTRGDKEERVVKELDRTYLGRVSRADRETGDFEVDLSGKWNGEQFAPFGPITVYNPLKFDLLFDYIKPGDEVVCAMGDTNGMLAVGLVGDRQSTQKQLSWMVGDPNVMPSPFVGDYKVTYTATPDCDSCSGPVCNAQSVDVMVKTVGFYEGSKEFLNTDCGTWTLLPDGTCEVTEDGNRKHLEILFISSSAPASKCPWSEITEEIEPTAYFFIRSRSTVSATPTVTPVTDYFSPPPEYNNPNPTGMGAEAASSVPGFGIITAILGFAAAMVVIRR